MRKEVKLRMCNVIPKRALQSVSETWVLREQDKVRMEASETRFLRPLAGISLRD
jgi:hypothetical protein